MVQEEGHIFESDFTESYQEGTSMTRPPSLDSSNYGYQKVWMQTFIGVLDRDFWCSTKAGWSQLV